MSELIGEELRLAVAVKLGFMLDDNKKTGSWPGGVVITLKMLPGYDWDLNAAWEAERVYIIPKRLGQKYYLMLDDAVGDAYGAYHATATQRMQCLLEL